MAVAGTHEQIGVKVGSWRDVAKHAYYSGLAAIGVALFVFIPPTFDLTPRTLFAVAVVAWFLVAVERPHRATGTSIAPLTSVLTAATVVFGWWSFFLAFAGWTAVFWRAREGKTPVQSVMSSAFIGQIGLSAITTYTMMGVITLTLALQRLAPEVLAAPIMLVGVLLAGLAGQTANNLFVTVGCSLVGTRFAFWQFLRPGVVGSLWAYFLTALYGFGGILATVLFYIIVANSRMMERVLGMADELAKADRVQWQAQGLLVELMRFTDTNQIEFAREVRHCATMLARHLGLPKQDIESVGLAASLHEIGLCRLEPAVRLGTNLTPGQLSQRGRYSHLGAQMLREAHDIVPLEVSDAVEMHTERFDGAGYPRGIAGEKIPLAARILAVARDYVALVSGSGGGAPLTKTNALEQMRERAGSQYDPGIVDLLCRQVA